MRHYTFREAVQDGTLFRVHSWRVLRCAVAHLRVPSGGTGQFSSKLPFLLTMSASMSSCGGQWAYFGHTGHGHGRLSA
ncbi:MAG: hypothetical protein QM757_20500 [Paludibaculum sp.]